MTTPKKERILRRGKAIAMERQVRAGLPAITPSEKELKESGAFREAQLSEMRVDQEVLAEQRKYLQEMASEFRLMVIPLKGLRVLKRETGYEWTNGWTKHKKRKPTTKIPSPQKVPCPYCDELVTLTKRGVIPTMHLIQHKRVKGKIVSPQRVSLRKPLDIGSAVRGTPLELPTPIIQKPKRKKRHVERSGKTMRALRKIDGVKVFSFPDDVWKVRKPRKRRRK